MDIGDAIRCKDDRDREKKMREYENMGVQVKKIEGMQLEIVGWMPQKK